jgi:HAMP domain-containing protein
MRVAAAPIRLPQGRVAGAILVGFVMTDKEARAKSDLFGTEVAYTLDGRVVATSFRAEGEGENAKEDVERAKELSQAVYKPGSPAQAALAVEKPSDIFAVKVRGEEFLAVVAPLPGNSVNKSSGVVLLKSVTQSLHPVSAAGTTVVLFGLLALLVALGASVLTARRFLGPLDELENGVAEVINGNLDYTFARPSPDYEGLANALNVMLARLLGRPEPNEEEDGDQAAEAARRWRTDSMFVEDIDPGQAGGGVVTDPASLQLAQEPVDAYYKRTYEEYVAAKRQVGEKTDGVTLENFRAKLSQNETALKGKYKCKMVRFRVVVKDRQVTLKPVPIY